MSNDVDSSCRQKLSYTNSLGCLLVSITSVSSLSVSIFHIVRKYDAGKLLVSSRTLH